MRLSAKLFANIKGLFPALPVEIEEPATWLGTNSAASVKRSGEAKIIFILISLEVVLKSMDE